MPKLRLLKYSVPKEYDARKMEEILKDIILSNEQIMFNKDTGHKHTGVDGDGAVVDAGSATKIPVSSADLTPDYLYNKITVSGSISKAITSPGGNEKLQLTVPNVPATTTDLPEGTNLYYTTARATVDARASISEIIVGISYNNSTGVLSMTDGLWDIGACAF